MTAPISFQLARSELVYLSSTDVTGSCRPIPDFFTGHSLRAYTTGGMFFGILKKRRAKTFSVEIFQSPKCLSGIFCLVLQKYLLPLYCMGNRGINLLRIFLRHFVDRTDVSLPFIHPLFDPISFVFFIPNITAKITCACAHPKPINHAK